MLHIDALTVSAFRGVPGELTLNLTSPLTLLYAPNGTGKTTVCDAIEWTLTGNIERISEMPQQFLRCQHASADRPTLVRATIVRSTRQMQVRRDFGEDRVLVTTPDSPERRITPSAFLELLVPNIATDFADARARLSRRKAWIVGTHFLSTERLARLMDSDVANRERRAELFADLLGVGQLQRLVPRFEKVILGARKRREDAGANADRLNSRLAELQSQLSRTGAVVDITSTMTAIFDTASTLGISLPTRIEGSSDSSKADLLRELAVTVDSVKALTAQQWPAWRSLLEWATHAKQVQGTPIVTSDDIAELLREHAAAGERVALERQRAARLAVSRRDLAAQLSRLNHETSVLRSARGPLERFAAGAGHQSKSLAQLMNAVEAVNSSAIADKASAARQLKGVLSEACVRDSRLREARAQLATMREEQQLAALLDTAVEHLDDCREREDLLKRQWEALASVGQQIAELGRDYAGSHAQSGHCPLCAHDWRTVESLRAAIASASDRLLPEVSTIKEAYALSRDATAEAERKKQRAMNSLESRRAVVVLIRQLEQQLQPFWHDCERVGLSSEQPPSVAAVDDVISACARHEAALAATHAIREILRDLNAAAGTLGWAGALDSAIATREALRAELEAKLSEFDQQSTLLTTAISASETAQAILKERLVAAERALAEANATIARRDTAAKVVGLDKPLSGPMVEQAYAVWETRRKGLAELESQLQSASNSFLAQTWRSQIIESEARVAAAHAMVQIASQRSEDLEALQKLLSDGLEAAKESRIDGLRTGVEALFLKMHAARIAEGVKSTTDSCGFAVRIGDWMSDAEYLSQGQRQDLAIAIFLARARAYGGTFFLDEPLLHLDDLNRVALLDVLRAIAIQEAGRVRLVVTTASSIVLRHLQQKCMGIFQSSGIPVLRAYDLTGTVTDGVKIRELDAA